MPDPKSIAVLVCYFCGKAFAPDFHHACSTECCLVDGLIPGIMVRLHYDFCTKCRAKTLSQGYGIKKGSP